MNATKWTILTAFLLSGALSSPAQAHVDINYPMMRDGNQKTGPCEGKPLVGGDPVTTLLPGSTLEIQITETIPHPGHFRVMFDDDVNDGEDFPAPTACDEVGVPDGVRLLADNLLPAQGASCPGFHTPSERTPTQNEEYTISVTLPDIECDNCALQVIQVMTDESKQDANGNWDPTGGRGLYFRCANIKLDANAEPEPEPDPDPMDPDVEPEPMDPDLEPEPLDENGQPINGGCSQTGGSAGYLAFAILLLGWMRKSLREVAQD